MSEWANYSVFWANRSFSLSLTKNERFPKKIQRNRVFLYVFTVFLEVFKKSKSFTHSFWAKWVNCSGRSGQMSNPELFAQVAQKEWAIVSESLRSLTKNQQMSESLTYWGNRSFAHFLAKNERFPPKFDERMPNPEFSALIVSFHLIKRKQ